MSQLNRRRFLEDSLFASTAALAAASAGRQVRAEENRPSDSPNEKLGVAILGVRGRGTEHIDNFAGRADTEVLYIVDPDSKVGERRAEECGKKQDGRVPKYVADLRTAFEDPAVDVVSIATPNHWHALAAIWAIQAGKDVYVEKPVSHNVSEGRRIVEAARKHKKIVQTGTQCRSNQAMKDAVAYLRSGQLGAVKVARGLCYKTRTSIGPKGQYQVPASVNYDLWAGPAHELPVTRRQFHYDWHWIWEFGNGDLGNQGIHQMDIARWGLGVDNLGDSVISYGGRLGYEDAGETANTQVSIHQYGDKRLVFEVRGLKTEDYRGARVGNIFHCEQGYVVMTGYSSGAAFDLDGKPLTQFSGGGDHFGNFIAAVRSRKTEDLNAEILEGHLSSALCHLGNIAYRLGESIPASEVSSRLGEDEEAQETLTRTLAHLAENGVSPGEAQLHFGNKLVLNTAEERFADNAVADAMLSREYRAPFVVPAAGQV